MEVLNYIELHTQLFVVIHTHLALVLVNFRLASYRKLKGLIRTYVEGSASCNFKVHSCMQGLVNA